MADVAVVDITPALAEQMLGGNTHNRGLRQRHVNTLAEAMARGEWRLNGAPICLSESGVLLDGQHRLAAVVKSGCTVQSLVVKGIADEAQMTMDVGMKRSFAQVLGLRGVGQATTQAALTRRVFLWEQGFRRNPGFLVPTFAQLLETFEQHQDSFVVAIQEARHFDGQFPISRTVMALAYWLLDGVGPEDTDYFFARLKDGADLPQGSPILALREALQRPIPGADTTHHKADSVRLALIIKGWNAYREEDEVQLLRFRLGAGKRGQKPETYPEPI